MTKAKTSTKTMGDGAIEPALFTHDGYRLHVFDGVPCMLDTDLGKRLGMAEDKAIRKLIERQEDNLLLLDDPRHRVAKPGHDVPVSPGTLRRGPAPRRKGSRGPAGHAYYLDQQQVRWIVIKSGMPEADVLLRQLFSVFDAWEKGQLVTRAEAAEAKLAIVVADPRPQVPSNGWPRHVGFEHSLFLTAGAPAAVPSGFVRSIDQDNRFTRFETKLGITVTATEDQVRVFDVDLGHAIGGQCTLKVRPRVREIQSVLRQMGPDPWYNIAAYQQLGHEYKLTSVYLLNHEQAKAVAAVMDPHGHTDIHYRLDHLFYHILNGKLSEIVSGDHAMAIARASDLSAKKHRNVPDALRQIPQRPTAIALPATANDPFQLLMIQEAAAKAVEPMIGEIRRMIDDGKVAVMRTLLETLASHASISEKTDALIKDEVESVRKMLAQGTQPDPSLVMQRTTALIQFIKAKLGTPPSSH